MMRLHIGALVLISMAAYAVPVFAQEDAWWNNDWARRRPVQVRNVAEKAMTEGYTLRIKSDLLTDLIREKRVKDDLSDVRIVYGTKEIPRIIEKVAGEPGKDSWHRIWFKAQKPLAPGDVDSGYWLYYGNPSAGVPDFKHSDVLPFYDDFDGDKLDESRWTADPAIEYTVSNGELVITDLTRTEGAGWSNTDAFSMKGVTAMEEFMLEAQVSYEDDPNTGIFAVWLKANFQKAEPANAELDKKIKDLITKLGDEDWDVREKATKDLEDVGEPAVPYLEQALQDPDPEIRMRAGSVLGQTRTKLVPNSSQVGINDSWAQTTGCKAAMSGSIPPYNTQPGTVASATTHMLTIIKDASGRIDLQFDNSLLLSSTMKGSFSSLAISLGRFQNQSFGTVKIGRVILRKYMNPEPSLMVDVEQTSK